MPMVSRSEFLPWLPPIGRKALFALALAFICFAFAFPVLWLILTSLRPESGVYYVIAALNLRSAASPRC